MAYIKKFNISNFKGIEHLSVDMCGRHKTPVITLVGLNESGKTTILEAISHFLTNEGTISEGEDGKRTSDRLSLVPIANKANFTGKITIRGKSQLDKASPNNKNPAILLSLIEDNIPSRFFPKKAPFI
jgi:AAA15 family ATPase/GTPase